MGALERGGPHPERKALLEKGRLKSESFIIFFFSNCCTITMNLRIEMLHMILGGEDTNT